MKAVILAAGEGTRLGEMGRKLPKPMIEFNGKPILQHNLELCKAHGIKKIFINTHHLPEKIRGYFGDGSSFGVSINYSYEPQLLGTAGALNSFRTHLRDDRFFVLYGDNYSDFDLSLLEKAASEKDSVAIVAFHYREEVSQSGVGEFDRDGRIVRFVEKPADGETDSHWVNAGIYYLSPQIFDYVPAGFSDFGKDIFPRLLRDNVAIYGVCSKVPLRAFDTPELLRASLASDHDAEK